MEEIIDILNENDGSKTGQTILKSEAHKNGIFHDTIHLFIINKDKNKVLLQKRCEDKKLFPNLWDASVGGHVSSGEKPIESLKREMQEELGLNIEEYEVIYINRLKESLEDNNIKCNEYVSLYIIYYDIDLNNLKLQKEEVSKVEWFNKEEINNLLKNNEIVPHYEEYKILSDYLN